MSKKKEKVENLAVLHFESVSEFDSWVAKIQTAIDQACDGHEGSCEVESLSVSQDETRLFIKATMTDIVRVSL